MKRGWIAFIVGGLLGAAAGFALGIFVYPYLFLANIVAAETLDRQAAGNLVAQGEFIHANPSDPIHYGKGKVSVYREVVYLEQDFEVGPGPKFHVYLVPEADVTPSTRVAQTKFVDLGRLKAFKGSQNYAVPRGVNLADYPSLVIWCGVNSQMVRPEM